MILCPIGHGKRLLICFRHPESLRTWSRSSQKCSQFYTFSSTKCQHLGSEGRTLWGKGGKCAARRSRATQFAWRRSHLSINWAIEKFLRPGNSKQNLIHLSKTSHHSLQNRFLVLTCTNQLCNHPLLKNFRCKSPMPRGSSHKSDDESPLSPYSSSQLSTPVCRLHYKRGPSWCLQRSGLPKSTWTVWECYR